LSSQAEHHGYAKRILPPVFVDQYLLNESDDARLSPKHAIVIAKFHLVFSTSGRRGILGSQQGRKIAQAWRELDLQIALIKVSFVPDHVHIALRSHPAASPASIVSALMNSAQEVVKEELIEAGVNRLWMNSAYVGAYGDLSSPQIRKFIEGWKNKGGGKL
jgi:REP element-mobilizing transposase RayT